MIRHVCVIPIKTQVKLMYRCLTVLHITVCYFINPLNAELNPIRHLLALVGARHIVHVSTVRVKSQELKPTK